MLCVWWNSEGVIHWEFVPNVRAVDVDLYSQQMERVLEILRQRYLALVNRKTVLLQQDKARPHTARAMTKNRELGETELLPYQHTALILCLQITISFPPGTISCVEQISKTLKLRNWVSPISSRQKPETGIIVQDHRM